MVHIVVSVSCHAQPNYSTGSYSTGSENQSKSYSAPTRMAFDDTDPPWSQSWLFDVWSKKHQLRKMYPYVQFSWTLPKPSIPSTGSACSRYFLLMEFPPKLSTPFAASMTTLTVSSQHKKETASFPVQTGVLQGDTLAPFLFVIVLDYVLRGSMTPEFRLTLKRRQSSRHSAVFLTDLDFADDIALLSDTIRSAQVLLPWSVLRRKLVFSLTNRKPKHLSIIHVQQMACCLFRLVQ